VDNLALDDAFPAPRLGQREAQDFADLAAQQLGRDARREVGSHRPEHVASVERSAHRLTPELRPVQNEGPAAGRHRHDDRHHWLGPRTPWPLPCQSLHQVCEQATVRGHERPHGSREHQATPCRADVGVNDREVDGITWEERRGRGENESPFGNVLRRHLVRDINDLRVAADGQDDALDGPHVAVARPEVGRQGDGGHRYVGRFTGASGCRQMPREGGYL